MAQLLGDRYELLRPLGAGGMGAVSLALDTWRPGHEVALKLAPVGDEPRADALAEEFTTLSLLRHPGVVAVREFGWCPRARQPFLAMEVGGAADVAEAGQRRSVEGIAALAARVCETLAFVHSRGVVHGDVKAENVLVRSDGVSGGEHVILADFGLSRRAGLSGASGATTFSGTLTHAAPELLAGRPADARTDLYALGVTIFALLAGRLPFDERDPLALAEAHRTREAPPVRSLRADVPEAFAGWVARLLAKDPARRPATAHAVLAALHEVFPRLSEESDGSLQAWARAPRQVGCQEAEEACAELVARARDPGRPGSRALALEGAEGSGKTRLLHATRILAQRSRTVTLWGAPGADPWSLFAGLMRDALRLAGIAPGDASPALALIEPGLGSAAERLPAGLSAEDRRLAVGRAVWETLILAAVRPTVLLLDDVDRCDAESRWLLSYLLRQADRQDVPGRRMPLAIILAATPSTRASSPSSLPELVQRQPLAPLDAAGITLLVESMFPGCDGGDRLVAVLIDGVGARAALIESWCSTLVREGALRPSRAGWKFSPEHAASHSPPRDLAASVAASLVTLTPAQRALLLDLALLPRAVEVAALMDSCVGVGVGVSVDVDSDMDVLQRRELAHVSVREDGRSVAIASELWRQAALVGVDAGAKRARAAALLVAPPLLLALGSADRASLAVSAERLDVARALLGEALAEATVRDDHARAALFAARLAEITTDAPRREACRRGAAALVALERLDEAAHLVDLAGSDAGADEAAAQAALEGRLELRRGGASRAAELLGFAVARAGPAQLVADAQLVAEWKLDHARAASAAGLPEAGALLDALAAGAGEDLAAVRILLACGAHQLRLQRTREAVVILERAAALARALGAVLEEAACENNLGVAALRADNREAAARHLHRSIELRLARGARGAAAGALMNVVLLELDRGRATAALKAARECLAVHEEIGSVRGELLARTNMAVAHALREDWTSCEAQLRRSLELQPRAGDPATHIACLLVEADLLRSVGLRDRAAALAREAVAAAETENSARSRASALMVAAACNDAPALAALSALVAEGGGAPTLRVAGRCVLVDCWLDGSTWTAISADPILPPSPSGDVARARAWAVAAFEDARIGRSPELLSARLALALVEARSGNDARVAELLSAASIAEEKAARPSTRATLSAARGWVAARAGDLALAESCFERSLEIGRSQVRRIPRPHRESFLASHPWAGCREALLAIRHRRLEAERAGSFFSVLEASTRDASVIAEARVGAGPGASRAAAAADRRADRLAEILEISRGINALLPVSQLLEATLSSAMRFMDADRGFIVLCSTRGLEFAVSRDRTDRPLARAEFAISRSVLDEVIRTKETVLSDNAREDERFLRGSSVLALDLRSVLVAPLVARAEVVGAIYLDNHHASGVFDENDRELLALLATQAAVAVENARLHAASVEKERIDNELGIARAIQQGLLPTTLPGTSAFAVAAAMEPAREIGGDYYDFIEAGDGRLRVAVGDVSGKGVAAGLFMIMARTILRSLAASSVALDLVLAEANDALESQIEDDKFMTMLLLEPSNDGRSIRACVAGHEPPMVWRRAGGGIESLPAGGLALGMLRDIGKLLEEQVIPMASGDVMACYSDGVTECRSPSGELYGRERLAAAIAASGAGGAQSVLDAVLASVARFRGDADRSDDITLVILEARA